MGVIKAGRRKVNRTSLTFSIGNSVSFVGSSIYNSTQAEKLILHARVVSVTSITQVGLFSVDGISFTSGDIILCTGQTDQKLNGLYYASSVAWTRIESPLLACHLVFVLEGTNNVGTVWKNTNTVNPTIGVSNITYIKPFLFSANNLSDVANASTARSNLGLGTIATQSASSVNITGGTATFSSLQVTGANSTITAGTGNFVNITSKSSGIITLQNSGGTGANFRLLQGAVDGSFPVSSGAAMTFQMTNTSNNSPLLSLLRIRNSGVNTDILNTQVFTSSVLSTDDKISYVKRITPSSGTNAFNYFQMGISDASGTIPSSYEDVFVTEAGVVERSTRFAARMLQICRSTYGAVRLFVSSAIATTYDLIFPDTAPAENNILVYNSSGQAAWHRYNIPQTINTDITAKSNSHYIVNATGTGQIIITLPTAANSKIGDIINITRAIVSEKDWRISQQSNQQILWNTTYSTIGTSGWAESDSIDSSVTLLCIINDTTDTRWQIIQHEGDVVLG